MALARLRRRTPTTALLDDDRSCGRSGKVGLVGGMSSVVSSNALVDVDAVRGHVGVDAGGKVCRETAADMGGAKLIAGHAAGRAALRGKDKHIVIVHTARSICTCIE
jgi:hypothetical protein